ncbi:radical SAM protein [bacterium]
MNGNKSYILRLGFECNQKCLFCNITPESEPRVRRLTTEEANDVILHQFKREQVNTIVFSGGEPLVRKDLEKLIAYAREIGIGSTCLQTNAMGLSRERAGRLKSAGLNTAFIPLHSFLEEIFEKTTQVKGSFASSIRGTMHLLEQNVLVGINIVVSSLNYDHIDKTVRFVHKEFGGRIPRISFSTVQPRGFAAENGYIIPDYHLLTGYLEKGLIAAGECGIEVDNPQCGVPLCIWPADFRNLCMESVYNSSTRNRSLDKMLFLDRHGQDNDKIKFPLCSECTVKNLCCGVWRDFEYFPEKTKSVQPHLYSYKCWE